MKVIWDDDIPNIWKNTKHVPNHQPEKHVKVMRNTSIKNVEGHDLQKKNIYQKNPDLQNPKPPRQQHLSIRTGSEGTDVASPEGRWACQAQAPSCPKTRFRLRTNIMFLYFFSINNSGFFSCFFF